MMRPIIEPAWCGRLPPQANSILLSDLLLGARGEPLFHALSTHGLIILLASQSPSFTGGDRKQSHRETLLVEKHSSHADTNVAQVFRHPISDFRNIIESGWPTHSRRGVVMTRALLRRLHIGDHWLSEANPEGEFRRRSTTSGRYCRREVQVPLRSQPPGYPMGPVP
jgi:hypothetical protein